MAEENTEEQDPSIEEILDSIRQIISDDEEDGDDVATESATPEPEPAPEPEEEVIELTEKVEPEEESAPEPEPEPEPDVIDEPEEESILTNAAEKATFKGFTEVVRKTAIEHNGITLEEIVRTELRPLLKDWLDGHLPSIIERLVQDELEKLSKRALEE